MTADFLTLARPRQWAKNLLVLAALLFSGKFLVASEVLRSLLALLAFVLLSSSVYAVNDALDLEQDKRHPDKKKRPVASGRISRSQAFAFGGICAGAGLGVALSLGWSFAGIALAYLAVSSAYSLWAKHQVILDVLVLATGFVLRAAAGALALQVKISEWLLVCTTLLALFLALAKRRSELSALEGGAKQHRPSLGEYSIALLDQMIAVVASASLVAYSLYAFSAHAGPRGAWMMLTIPFVLYGIFRYLYLSHRRGLGGAPEQVLMSDLPTQLNLLFYVATSAAILFLQGPRP